MELTDHSQPPDNDADTVPSALEALRAAHDEASAHEAYDQFLWAVGNNHAGTYWPIVLATMPAIEELLAGGSHWAQRAAMECLIDLGGSFTPEQGEEMSGTIDVKQALRSAIASMRPLVTPLATGDDARSVSAAELVELIDDFAI